MPPMYVSQPESSTTQHNIMDFIYNWFFREIIFNLLIIIIMFQLQLLFCNQLCFFSSIASRAFVFVNKK
jgi:hypothetical protein